MNIFKLSIGIIITLVLIVFFIFFRNEVFLFLENLRMALWGSVQKEFSYRNLLEYKLNMSSPTSSLLTFKNDYFSEGGFNYVKVRVFSNYPFNDYSRLVIEGGKDKGLKSNMPVLVSQNILLGRIIEVREKTSVVETFFDASWKSSVIIGKEKIKGLLKGGINPEIDFVLEDAKVEEKDIVYNADSKFPFGLEIGQVGEGKKKNNWQVFPLFVSYDLNSLSELLVITNFE